MDKRLQGLRGSSRRDFLRWGIAAATALGLERTRYFDVLNDTGGTALADMAAANTTSKSIHIVAAVGGLAWFTQLFPYPGVARSGNGGAALYAGANLYKAASTDRPAIWAPDSPFQSSPANKQATVFVAGKNEAHTQTPTSAFTLGNNNLLAAVSAIQAASPTLLPVMAINPIAFGSAPGAATPATVTNAAGLVDLFDSEASKSLLKDPANAQIAEAYFNAFTQLNAAAGQKTLAKAYGTARTAQSLLAKNLAEQLKMTAEDDARYGIDDGTPTSVSELGRAIGIAMKAFKLGLTSSLVVPAMNDDPHGAFQDMTMLASTVRTLGKILDACVADAGPEGVVITINGDTPKDANQASGWSDGTAQDHNLLIVYGNGHLKTGWFGDLDGNAKLTTWDPVTGNSGGGMSSAQLAGPASAAVAYAVAKGDDRRVQDFGVAAPKGVIVPKTA